MKIIAITSLIISLLLIVGCNFASKENVVCDIQVEKYYQNLGGVEQYIEVMKTSDKNPVLLWVHGGPGFPITPYLRFFNQDISKQVTVVI